MGLLKIEQRASGDNTGWINLIVAVIVVALDMIHIDRLGHARPLIDFPHIVGKVGIICDALNIALEVAVIDCIKTHQGGKKANVSLC